MLKNHAETAFLRGLCVVFNRLSVILHIWQKRLKGIIGIKDHDIRYFFM